MRSFLVAAACGLAFAWAAEAAKTLDFYFVDVEGGQATLIVTPKGESLLVDTGWPGFNNRDATRIAAAAKAAGVKRIDYLLITHYHLDHVGGVKQLLVKLPVRTFVDHGPNRESGKGAKELDEMYAEAVKTGQHLVVKPGDKLPLKGLDVEFLTSDGAITSRPGTPNPLCQSAAQYPEDKSENARSAGFLLTYGNFHFLDLGDLTGRKETEVACAQNRVGPVDLYLTTHHGLDQSNAEALVHAIRPRVAVMNNGARKGGSPKAWQTVRSSPGLEDLWQLHFAIAGGKETNSPEPFIANLSEDCAGWYIKASAAPDGTVTVTNARNRYVKTYKPGTQTAGR